MSQLPAERTGRQVFITTWSHSSQCQPSVSQRQFDTSYKHRTSGRQRMTPVRTPEHHRERSPHKHLVHLVPLINTQKQIFFLLSKLGTCVKEESELPCDYAPYMYT
jgi:hypothetical protein